MHDTEGQSAEFKQALNRPYRRHRGGGAMTRSDPACDYCDHYQIEHDHDEANGSTRCTVSTCGCLEYVEGCHDCEAT